MNDTISEYIKSLQIGFETNNKNLVYMTTHIPTGDFCFISHITKPPIFNPKRISFYWHDENTKSIKSLQGFNSIEAFLKTFRLPKLEFEIWKMNNQELFQKHQLLISDLNNNKYQELLAENEKRLEDHESETTPVLFADIFTEDLKLIAILQMLKMQEDCFIIPKFSVSTINDYLLWIDHNLIKPDELATFFSYSNCIWTALND